MLNTQVVSKCLEEQPLRTTVAQLSRPPLRGHRGRACTSRPRTSHHGPGKAAAFVILYINHNSAGQIFFRYLYLCRDCTTAITVVCTPVQGRRRRPVLAHPPRERDARNGQFVYPLMAHILVIRLQSTAPHPALQPGQEGDPRGRGSCWSPTLKDADPTCTDAAPTGTRC